MSTYHVYCDESSTDKGHQYMVFGGVMLRQSTAHSLRESISRWKVTNGLHSEIKWTSTDHTRLERYKEFATGIVRYAERGDLRIKAIVIDQSKIDYKRYHDNDKDLGYYKFLYQYVLHCFAKHLDSHDKLVVYLDQRFSKYKLTDLKAILNNGVRKLNEWDRSVQVVRNVEARDSKQCHFIQAADLVAGAVACHNNKSIDPNSARGKSKQALMEHIMEESGVSDFRFSSPLSIGHFGVWHFRPRTKNAP